MMKRKSKLKHHQRSRRRASRLVVESVSDDLPKDVRERMEAELEDAVDRAKAKIDREAARR
jgi:hypothetical protein